MKRSRIIGISVFRIPIRLIARSEACGTVETPLPDPAGVNVDEVRVRIVADSAASEGESCKAQRKGVDAGHTQVNGFRLNVKAVSSDTGGASAKRFVC